MQKLFNVFKVFHPWNESPLKHKIFVINVLSYCVRSKVSILQLQLQKVNEKEQNS